MLAYSWARLTAELLASAQPGPCSSFSPTAGVVHRLDSFALEDPLQVPGVLRNLLLSFEVPAPLYCPLGTSFLCFLLARPQRRAGSCPSRCHSLSGSSDSSLRIGVLRACADEGILVPQHTLGRKKRCMVPGASILEICVLPKIN